MRVSLPADADAVTEVYLASRKTFVAFAPLAHADAEVRQWMTHMLTRAHGEENCPDILCEWSPR